MLTVDEARELSCPAQGPSSRAEVAGRLRSELQKLFVRGLVGRCRETLAARSPGLFDLLEAASREAALWSSSPGAHHAALVAATRGRETDDDWVAAMTGLALSGAVDREPWSVELGGERRVRLGEWVSPPVDRVDSTALDRLDERGWRRLPRVAVGAGALHLVPAELREVGPLDEEGWIGEAVVEGCAELLAEAVEVVAQGAPEYAGWIADVGDTIVPIEAPAGASTSRSYQRVPGVVVLGFPAPPATLGELLVHEHSHQYLHLVQAFRPLSNGRDERRYFSPFPRAERDVGWLLVGYHAFANIAAYYQRIGGEAAASWLGEWLPELETCHGYLEASEGLTPFGRALVEPVSQRIGLG